MFRPRRKGELPHSAPATSEAAGPERAPVKATASVGGATPSLVDRILADLAEAEAAGRPINRIDITFDEYKELYWSLMGVSGQTFTNTHPYPRREPDAQTGFVGKLFGIDLFIADYRRDIFLIWAQRAADGEPQPQKAHS